MKKSEIGNKVSRAISRANLHLRKHSPEVLIVIGLVGAVASTVMACRATIKARDIVESTKEDLMCVHRCIDGEISDEVYTEADGKKDLVVVYTKASIELAKIYLPAVILGAASVISILASNNILRKRNVALAAAYATIDRGYKGYRARLVERFGEEIDKELKYNLKAKEIEEIVVDENGEKKTVKRTIHTAEVDSYADYGRFFDNTCRAWERDPQYNRLFLKSQQQLANDSLQANGFLFLNDVYDMLGYPKTKAGQIVGWVYEKKDAFGDNYVDFGIYELGDTNPYDPDSGYNQTFILDFNVDGNILDRVVQNNLMSE